MRNGFGGLLFGGEGKCVLNKREWTNYCPQRGFFQDCLTNEARVVSGGK